MDNLIQNLLELDDKNFNTSTEKEVEIPRLSKATGKPFSVKIKSLTPLFLFKIVICCWKVGSFCLIFCKI